MLSRGGAGEAAAEREAANKAAPKVSPTKRRRASELVVAEEEPELEVLEVQTLAQLHTLPENTLVNLPHVFVLWVDGAVRQVGRSVPVSSAILADSSGFVLASFWRKSAEPARVRLAEVASAAEESQTDVFGRVALKKFRVQKIRGKEWTPLRGVHTTAGSEVEKLSAGSLEFALDFSLFQSRFEAFQTPEAPEPGQVSVCGVVLECSDMKRANSGKPMCHFVVKGDDDVKLNATAVGDNAGAVEVGQRVAVFNCQFVAEDSGEGKLLVFDEGTDAAKIVGRRCVVAANCEAEVGGLRCESARELYSAVLQDTRAAESHVPAARELLRSLEIQLWYECVKPLVLAHENEILPADAGLEARLIFAALPASVAEEAASCVALHEAWKRREAARRDAAAVSLRQMLQVRHEAGVRQLGQRLGQLRSAEAMAEEAFDRGMSVEEARRAGLQHASGTRLQFALRDDARLDYLRLEFAWGSRVTRATLVEAVVGEGLACLDGLEDLARLADASLRDTEPRDIPADFLSKCWDAYMSIVGSGQAGYFFSVEELALLAEVLNRRLCVFQDVEENMPCQLISGPEDVLTADRTWMWQKTQLRQVQQARAANSRQESVEDLAEKLRRNPTLPAWVSAEAAARQYLRLPLYSCPFTGCKYCTDVEEEFGEHLSGSCGPHAAAMASCFGGQPERIRGVELVAAAVSVLESRKFPCVGAAVTRRSLRLLAQEASDERLQALVCFVCGQIYVTGQGDGIMYQNGAWFNEVEKRKPGFWQKTCGFETWQERFGGEQTPSCIQSHLGDWAVQLPGGGPVLLGVTEDMQCLGKHHGMRKASLAQPQSMCVDCQLPVCWRCAQACAAGSAKTEAKTANMKSCVETNIPMAVANDHMYGFVPPFVIEDGVTWLEVAASSIIYTGMMVYYLEEPFGHLMLEKLEGPIARTCSRGNMFSFQLPWQAIQAQCEQLEQALPRDENSLSKLVNVHIVGSDSSIVQHLQGATMRVSVVLKVIRYFRACRFRGYDAEVNAEAAVAQRMHDLYGSKYGEGPFVPTAIAEAAASARRCKTEKSVLTQDKVATPAEHDICVERMDAFLRPLHFVAEKSGLAASEAQREQEQVLSRYETFEIQTGSALLDQFRPEYLSLAFPMVFTRPVGGYDVAGKPKWRRADAEPGVTLHNLVCGLPRRVEAQFRRHWTFVPGLYNLYFRDRLNRQISLRLQRASATNNLGALEQSATAAASELYRQLQDGYFQTVTGKRQRIAGDFSKLPFAENLRSEHKQLLADFRFRTQSLPGTQEIRARIGRVGFWGSVVYGCGVFMTVTPGERQNYLAVRFSRARLRDPHVQHGEFSKKRVWFGRDAPSLEPKSEDRFGVDIPGYDLRRLLLTQDPLAAALAFGIQIRVILASLLGFRMCARCPQCAQDAAGACADSFGSNATLMGGVGGRCDGICGAVEAQKTSGCLHFHFWAYLQRPHQHRTLQEIATMFKEKMLHMEEFKRFHDVLCQANFPLGLTEAEQARVEAAWPKFREATMNAKWEDGRPGRMPRFVWDDAKQTLGAAAEIGDADKNFATSTPGSPAPHLQKADMDRESSEYERQFQAAVQTQFEWSQLHIHARDTRTGARNLPRACRRKATDNTCKHGFPKDAYINLAGPLLVCKGIARARKLPCRGRRSMVGRVLPRRNSPWLNGTCAGLALGLSGANTDVKLNDVVPPVAELHEDTYCKAKNCKPVSETDVRRLVRRLARAQSVTNGYFGGYISKKQRLGQVELRKCAAKMLQLGQLKQGSSAQQQFRAASGRMISDLELNGTLRGAVETVNLCINAQEHDALAAECLRTFPTVSVAGRNWLSRAEAVLARKGAESLGEKRVPYRCSKVLKRAQATVPWVEAYAFRPAAPTELADLCPFEFYRFWAVEAVEVPTLSSPSKTAVLTELGRRRLLGERGKKGDVVLQPLLEYKVRKPAVGDTYCTFDDNCEQLFEEFRHMWVLRRRARPHVPVVEGDSSNLLELVQRPVIWRDKWEQYLSSGVMPKHTCQLVTNLLKATLCGDDRDVSDAEDEDKNGNETGTDRRAPPPLSAEEAKVVLGNADMACSTTAPKKKQKHAAALRTVEEVWGRVSESVAEGRQTKTVPLEECEAHLRARGAEEQACSRRLAAAQKEARLTIYPSRSNIHLRQWLADLQDRTMAPTQQQAALLEAVVSRLQAEAREEHATGRINAESPSMRHLVLGVPGSGKSLLIGWLREAFESVLGWVHGCQYVALAMQNCMAADIQGVTFHHYMGLQIGELQRALPDRQKFATQNQYDAGIPRSGAYLGNGGLRISAAVALFDGRLSEDNFFFLHGYPTKGPLENVKGCACMKLNTRILPSGHDAAWADLFLNGGWSGAELLEAECEACKSTREGRKRVLAATADLAILWQQPPYDRAPMLHPFNVPRYRTLTLRAKTFAAATGQQLCWSFAADYPLWEESRSWSREKLQQKRVAWLQFHDQKTAHLNSVLPLIRDLPVRLTETIDRSRQLYRGRRGVLKSWTWEEKTVLKPTTDGVVASCMPRCVYVAFAGATWKVGAGLEKGVYPLTPAVRTWVVNNRTGAKIRRRGFFLVPDFAGTAHMMQGQSLEALFCDLVYAAVPRCPTSAEHLAAYVMISRIRELQHLIILQPFDKQLFASGGPVGPQLMLHKFERQWSEQQLTDAWARTEVGLPERSSKNQWTCAECLLHGRPNASKKATAFETESPTELDKAGAWLRCRDCTRMCVVCREYVATRPQRVQGKRTEKEGQARREVLEPVVGYCCLEAAASWRGYDKVRLQHTETLEILCKERKHPQTENVS
ncbi:esrp2 [Symbiodinium microadriaticum]|nr:esrp2 [Symbiodinium microadriaticum]